MFDFCYCINSTINSPTFMNSMALYFLLFHTCVDPEGGAGGPDSPEKSQKCRVS